MSDQFIQTASASGTTTAVVTLSGVASNSTLVAFLFDGNTAGAVPLSVSDGQGSYTGGANASDTTNGVRGKVFTLAAATSGTHTITGTVQTGDACFMQVVESGAATSSPVSGTNGQFQSSPGTGANAVSSGSVTATGAATLIGFSTDSASAVASNEPAVGTGFTSRDNNANGTIGAYRLETGAVSANAAATFTAITGTDSFVTLAAAVLNSGAVVQPDTVGGGIFRVSQPSWI